MQNTIIGLEDPLVLANYTRNDLAIEDYFVRVLFIGGNHWVCVAGGYNCEYRTHSQKIATADVALYDSGGTPRKRSELEHIFVTPNQKRLALL